MVQDYTDMGSRMGDSNIWIGYVVNINNKWVFINQKGYYQTPSGTPITSISFPEGSNDEVIINYEYNYLEFQDSSIATAIYPEREILGQLSGTFFINNNITDLVNQKYYFIEYKNGYEIIHYVGQWLGLDLDLTPYTIVKVKYVGDSEFSTLYVGRTGVLNMFNDTPIAEMYIAGRRMVVVDASRQPYLDEWECVFDESTKPDSEGEFTSSSWYDTQTGQETGIPVIIYNEDLDLPYDEFWNKWEDISSQHSEIIDNVNEYGYYSPYLIKNPKYNTIYGFYNGENNPKIYKIYYIDGCWYDVDISQVDSTSLKGIVIANTPIEGMINYKVQVLTKRTNSSVSQNNGGGA